MSAISGPGSLLTVHASSTQIQILSIAKLAAGLTAFIAPAFFTQRVFGFTQRTTAGSSATASSTTPRSGSPEELSISVRMSGARDIGLGLLLRDSTSAVVTRALQIGVITDILDIIAAAGGFVEGNLSREVATAVAGTAAVLATFQLWILNRT